MPLQFMPRPQYQTEWLRRKYEASNRNPHRPKRTSPIQLSRVQSELCFGHGDTLPVLPPDSIREGVSRATLAADGKAGILAIPLSQSPLQWIRAHFKSRAIHTGIRDSDSTGNTGGT